MNDLSQPRETGVAKSPQTCPQCGRMLPLVASSMGVRTGVCGPCSSGDQLTAQKAAAGVEESGTS